MVACVMCEINPRELPPHTDQRQDQRKNHRDVEHGDDGHLVFV